MALIEVQGLTKLYRMGDSIVRALDGVDLVVEPGEFVAITGPSGSGKSTMMHLLGCLDRPTSGSYVLNDRDVSDLSDRELAGVRNRDIGFVFQTFNLINRTSALENVGVPLFYARRLNSGASARTALERVGLGHRVSHNPSELSGGERQRVAIARAIVNDPVLLMADEPTGNLDSRTGEQIMQIFRSLNEQGVTIILVTHEPDVALQARRIVQMRDGRIVSDRPSSEMRAESGSGGLPQRLPEPDDALAGAPNGSAAPVGAGSGAGSPPVRSLRPRFARGATTVLVAGIAAPLLILGAMLVASLYAQRSGIDLNGIDRNAPPPEVTALVGSTALAVLLGVVLGLVAVFWGRGVLRRVRSEPGNWRGVGRARVGLVLGCVTLLVPVVGAVYGLVTRALR